MCSLIRMCSLTRVYYRVQLLQALTSHAEPLRYRVQLVCVCVCVCVCEYMCVRACVHVHVCVYISSSYRIIPKRTIDTPNVDFKSVNFKGRLPGSSLHNVNLKSMPWRCHCFPVCIDCGCSCVWVGGGGVIVFRET
jgi:hypothetical protein